MHVQYFIFICLRAPERVIYNCIHSEILNKCIHLNLMTNLTFPFQKSPPCSAFFLKLHSKRNAKSRSCQKGVQSKPGFLRSLTRSVLFAFSSIPAVGNITLLSESFGLVKTLGSSAKIAPSIVLFFAPIIDNPPNFPRFGR